MWYRDVCVSVPFFEESTRMKYASTIQPRRLTSAAICVSSYRWGCFYVFKPEKGFPHRLTVRAGLTRLTLFPGSVDLRIANVNDDKSAVSRSTPTAAFIRCVSVDTSSSNSDVGNGRSLGGLCIASKSVL